MRMGGPICWGCIRETATMSMSSCESEIYAANEGTKSVLTVRNLLTDFAYSEVKEPSTLYNDNRGTVDWTKGCSVSRKLRHINMRELLVRLHQKLGNVEVLHIQGKRNIADILTKEEKNNEHYRGMAFAITTPRLLKNWDHVTGDSIDDNGDISRPKVTVNPDPDVMTPGPVVMPTTCASAARGVLEFACTSMYGINGWISGYVPSHAGMA